MMTALLTTIIDAVTVKKITAFPSDAYESKFKYCLTKVKTTARVCVTETKRIVSVRPVNVGEFKQVLEANGLGHCELAMITVKWLETNPVEYLRFETDT